MSLNDPIADMLTRMRNGLRNHQEQVKVKASKICEGIAKVLKQEGYIDDYDRIDDNKQGILRIKMKYSQEGVPVIRHIQRSSRPGKRIYCSVDDLPYVLDGMGISIVSTSEGILSDKICREKNVSGEILCTVS